MRKIEKWRKANGLTHQDIADRAGCSRQYARVMCQQGTAAVAKAMRIIIISGGEIALEDFLRDKDRAKLVKEGLLGPSEKNVDPFGI